MKKLKKCISILLITSMIFNTQMMIAFSDGIDIFDNIGETEQTNYSISEDDDVLDIDAGVSSIIRPHDDFDGINNDELSPWDTSLSNKYEEEPEEDPTENIADAIIDDAVLNLNAIEPVLATASEMEETDIVDNLIEDNVVANLMSDNDNISTISETDNLSTTEDIISTYSDIEDMFDIATYSKIDIMIDVATNSDIDMNANLFGSGNEHQHRSCGGKGANSCTHDKNVGAEHNDEITYKTINEFTSGEGNLNFDNGILLEKDEKLDNIKKGEESILSKLTSNQTLYICLNGHNLTIGNDGISNNVVITNCGSQATIKASKKFAVGNVQIYGKTVNGNKNIIVNSKNYFIDPSLDDNKVYFYNVILKRDNVPELQGAVLNSTKNAKITFDDVLFGNQLMSTVFIYNESQPTYNFINCEFNNPTATSESYSFITSLGDDNKLTINFYNNNIIKNINMTKKTLFSGNVEMNIKSGTTTFTDLTIETSNTACGNLLPYEGILTVEDGAKLKIVNNKLYNNESNEGKGIYFPTSNIYGELIVKNNVTVGKDWGNIIYLDDGKTITIGDNPIQISNNTIKDSNTNDNTTPVVIGINVKGNRTNNGFLKVCTNKTLNPNNYIENIYFAIFTENSNINKNHEGIILDNWSDVIGNNDNKSYIDMFTASQYAATDGNYRGVQLKENGHIEIVQNVTRKNVYYKYISINGNELEATPSMLLQVGARVPKPVFPVRIGDDIDWYTSKPNIVGNEIPKQQAFDESTKYDFMKGRVPADGLTLWAKYTPNEIHKHKVCGITYINGQIEECHHITYEATNSNSYTNNNHDTDIPTFVPIDNSNADIELQSDDTYGSGNTNRPNTNYYYYLTQDLNLTTAEKKYTIKKNIHICLNGFSISLDGYFSKDDSKSSDIVLVITNCKQESKIEIISDGGNEQGLANNLKLEIYGKTINNQGDKNIIIQSDVFAGTDKSNGGVYYYNVQCEPKHYGSDDIKQKNNYIYLYKDMTFENVIFDAKDKKDKTDNSGVNFLYAEKDAYNLNVTFKNCQITNLYITTTVFVGKVNYKFSGYNLINKLTLGETLYNASDRTAELRASIWRNDKCVAKDREIEITDGTLKIDDNKMNSVFYDDVGYLKICDGATLEITNNNFPRVNDTDQSIFTVNTVKDSSNKPEILGNLTIADNRFTDVSALYNDNKILAAMYIGYKENSIEGAKIKIGSGAIKISENYRFSGTDILNPTPINNHIYQLYSAYNSNSSDSPIFVQAEGTKFNTNTKIDGIAFQSNGKGYIINKPSDYMTDLYYATQKCFIADKKNENNHLIVKLDDNNNVIIAKKDNTKFYTLNFNANGLSGSMEPLKLQTGNNNYTIATPTFAGLGTYYNFIGFASKSDATKQQILDSEPGTWGIEINNWSKFNLNLDDNASYTIYAIYETIQPPPDDGKKDDDYHGSGGGYSGGSGGGGGAGGGSGVFYPNSTVTPQTNLTQNNLQNTGLQYAINAPLIITGNTFAGAIKTISSVLDGRTSKWVVDNTTGNYKLVSLFNGQAAKNGFYMMNNYTPVGNYMKTITDTYYFNQNGDMVTGWVKTGDNKSYFFETAKNVNEGKMITGWKEISGSWYYFGKDGSMLTNTITPDGYYVGADGKYIKQ